MSLTQSFSSGIVQAPFVTSSRLLLKTWGVISSRDEDVVHHVGKGLVWKVCEESDLTVVVFDVKNDFDLQQNLVSSTYLKENNNFHRFEFLCTKKILEFSVNWSAVSLFIDNFEKLDQLKSKINSSHRLIVTGHGVGGAIASLFTVLLLESIGTGKKRPLCITFGSPLIGDKKLQEAISRSSIWNSCFLHVVSYKDSLPKKLSSQPVDYMPFGTFLFCSDTGATCFENPESVLELLVSSISGQSQGFEVADYGKLVENLYRKSICKNLIPRGLNLTHSTSLNSSIRFQLSAALGLSSDIQLQHQNIDINALATKLEALEKKFMSQKKVKFDPSKKLNMMKIDMANFELYKKLCKSQGIGYYDCFKKDTSTDDQDVIPSQKRLRNYWSDMVEEAEMKPQTEAAAFRTRWLFAGTNYRRMVEPLYIAEYYAKDLRKDYEAKGRSRHYIVLEKWLEEDKKEKGDSNGKTRRNVESILTFDSCFWAKLEEALLLCGQLENSTGNEEGKGKLVEFENYVYESLKKYEVSPEIFLKGSSYMSWWNKYKESADNHRLASFMSSPQHFDQYTEGAYFFP
ncbi:senescence-associated carboxylesterase 101 isoform X2 [Vigna radiata var. radiata]|uniref:Senescence-associated carboxylesterase 101 isoform X2 n=1 Tax=Vigna radiata var. radiata TaxID=3916 RepID=A0A1S3V343_VIGRR|nr:senescence-associated carboxylesterase 101 isoform X2 [Vigna radiata var. radiata]